MALKKNKVKFGLNKVHWAKITAWSDDGVPTFATPVRLPGAVSLSIDANGENDNFYADNTVYYVINNNAGYEGDLEVALITTDFATAILGEVLDSKGVLVESNDAETSQFALLFEFDGDKNHIRHVLYCCSASRPATEGQTTEESKEVKTETLSQGIGAPVRSGQVQDLRKHGRDHLQQLVQRCLYPDSSQPDERHGKYDQIHQDGGD